MAMLGLCGRVLRGYMPSKRDLGGGPLRQLDPSCHRAVSVITGAWVVVGEVVADMLGCLVSANELRWARMRYTELPGPPVSAHISCEPPGARAGCFGGRAWMARRSGMKTKPHAQ
jgi:hypothetical protein